MAKTIKKWWFIPVALVFAAYAFITPRPIPEETILKPRWITSLESNYPVLIENSVSGETEPRGVSGEAAQKLLPFSVGRRFGYVGEDGKFALSRVREGYVSLSDELWAEYDSLPLSIEVMNPQSGQVFSVENPQGYPLFLDERVFIVGKEQNSITELSLSGEALWTYDFPAPITCIDAAAGFVLAGTLDGSLLLLNASGNLVFPPFEPGGSRLSIISGCAISSDASRLAVISGIEDQRFLLLEHQAGTCKVLYHEFLTSGFRRPVHINFVDNDRTVAFEMEGGLGIYHLNSRESIRLGLEGEIIDMDSGSSGGSGGLLFLISSSPAADSRSQANPAGRDEKRFITVRFPGVVVSEAPFRSGSAFLARDGNRLYIAGDSAMASFDLEKR